MGRDPWGFDEERQALARRLSTRRRRLSWLHTGVALAFLAVLLAGASAALRTWATSLGLPSWAESSLFVAIFYAIGAVLSWPFGYLSGLRWEREAGLSTQSTAGWLKDRAKGFLLGLAAIVAAADVVLWLLTAEPAWWWLAAWALGLLVTVVISILAPVLLAPLFFRFRPLADPALRERFERLAAKAGVPVLGVFEMGASAKTRRSNAAVTGFGRTRRIIVTDTMLAEYRPEEVDTVLAHELGHQRHRDLRKGLLVGAAVSFVMLGVAAQAYAATLTRFGFGSLHDMAALPLLLLYSGIVSTALGPAELAWSRRRELRADRFSLEVTGDPAAFESAMVRLVDKNLGVAHPGRWEVWLHYTHPPGRQRVDLARSFATRPG